MIGFQPGRVAQAVWAALAFLFLLAPIFVLALASFDNAEFFRFPPRAWSLRWYEAALNSGEYRSALVASLLVALLASTLSLIAGSLAAYALVRFRPPGTQVLEAVLLAPLLLPLIVWAIALLQIYAVLGIGGTLAGLVLAHAVITLPYTIRIMASTFERIDPVLEQAAASLGATPWTGVQRVTLPLAMPGLVTSAAFSLLISFNDVVVSSLIAGSRWMTFPVRVYAQLRGQGVDPITLAIGTGIVTLILVLAILGERFGQWSRHL